MAYNFPIETDHEEDGRWIAEIPDLPGVLAYERSREKTRFGPAKPWHCEF